MTYPSNKELLINHDSIGRLTSIERPSGGNDPGPYVSDITYKESGQIGSWTLGGYSGGAIVEQFGYNSRLQLTSQTVTQSSQTRLSLTYSYQASAGQMGGGTTAGNAGQLVSVSGQIGSQTESAAYTYDNVGRLVTSNQTTNGVSPQRRFVYDRWGNRTEVWNSVSGGSQLQEVTIEQSGGAPTNRIESVETAKGTDSYEYDAAGNVIDDGEHTYIYDAENRLRAVDWGTSNGVAYAYDHQNRRIKKAISFVGSKHYVWEGSQVISEHDAGTGALQVEYVYANGKMIAREQGVNRVYFLNDRLSVRATITDGGSGSIQGRQGHLPFGEEIGGSGNTDKHKFTSYERDSESGLDYAVNRSHSPTMGRFMQADPYRASGYKADPQSWNRYSYTRNNPVNRVDRLGLEDGPPDPWPCWYDASGALRCPDVGGSVTINGSFNSGRGAGGTGPGGSGDEIEIEDGGEYESGGGQAGGGTPAVSLPNNLLNALENALTGLQNYLSGGITDDCSQNVIGKLSANLGFDLSAFKVYLAQGATFYDATRSNIPVAGNVMPRRPADLLYGPGATIADVFRNSPGTNAMTSIMTSTLTIFLRPGRDANRTPVVDRSNGGNNSRNLSLLFHEALHGFTKKVDADIQSSLGLGSGSSSNVTEYIKMHCF